MNHVKCQGLTPNIVAVGSNGSVYAAKMTKELKDWQSQQKGLKRLRRMLDNVSEAVRLAITVRLNEKKLTADDAQRIHWDIVWRLSHRFGYVDYATTLDNLYADIVEDSYKYFHTLGSIYYDTEPGGINLNNRPANTVFFLEGVEGVPAFIGLKDSPGPEVQGVGGGGNQTQDPGSEGGPGSAQEVSPTTGIAEDPRTYGLPDFRMRQDDIPQSSTPIKNNYHPPNTAEGRQIKRRQDIIDNLSQAFQIPIRTGKGSFAQRKARAFFKVKDEEAKRHDFGGSSRGVWSEESRCGGPGAPWDSLKARGGWRIRKMLSVNKRFDPFVKVFVRLSPSVGHADYKCSSKLVTAPNLIKGN